jgi:hypothetical protein
MAQVRRKDREIGGEHGGGDFAAVGAVADECRYEAWVVWEGLRGVNASQNPEERGRMEFWQVEFAGRNLRMPVGQHHTSKLLLLHFHWTS